ncbi:MAG: thiosulfohydrolase SoxB [Gallionella sp.]|nr:thiosulfohydrolase SoxB [Gallionella sp.]
MDMNRREFLQLLAIASAGGFMLNNNESHAATDARRFYELPRHGNVSLLHITDSHAQLNPMYFREPEINLGVGTTNGRPPHLVGNALLKHFGVKQGSPEAYAYTSLNFIEAARTYGKVGGFAHLATLVKQIRASRPGALLLDGGDTWQGSGQALWTKGQDMIDACLELGVDIMTMHFECMYGAQRIKEAEEGVLRGRIEVVAQNVKTTDFGDPVFKPYVIREINAIPVAIIGQAFPYSTIANPRYFVPDWSYGIQEENLQLTIDEARKKGAQVVVLLSHNGMDVDLKLASRVSGLDAILGGHTHDGIPTPIPVKNSGGTTLVTNAGSNGKFLGVLDFEVKAGKVESFKYKLLPVFANLLAADQSMTALMQKHRAPYEGKLSEKLATTDGLLYRRGNFNGSFDQVILDALMKEKDAPIAFSPGFRWGTSLLPGSAITMEDVLNQTAITYPMTTVTEMTGMQIKSVLEDVGDNLFNPDPYYQQGGDMVRVGGLEYTCEPNAGMGQRIQDMRLNGKLLDANKTYKVAGWAPVSEAARDKGGEPVWDLVARHLRAEKVVKVSAPNVPKLKGMAGNPGMI